MNPLIIIGAGLAGWTTAREFRKLDSATPVLLVCADSGDFYAKPSLSNAYAQKRSPEQLVTTPAAKMAESLQVTLLAHTQLESIDASAQTVTLRAQASLQTLPYRQLVLATGAQPIRVPVQGNAADQVRSVNSLADFSAFYAGLQGPDSGEQAPATKRKTVVIMGAGLIGCEFANDLAAAGYRVHVADPAARPLAALLPAAAGEQLAQALKGVGVSWHFGASVQSVDAGTSGGLAVVLSDGQAVHADAVLSAIGLRADTRLAAAAGMLCERGVVVDAQLQTSVAHVYALGDCAQYASAGQRTLPYVMPIMQAAKALAATLAGTPTPLVFPLMPVSIKTPALPVLVAPPHPSQEGIWVADVAEPDVWRFMDPAGQQRGFVTLGKQSARRMEFSKATVL